VPDTVSVAMTDLADELREGLLALAVGTGLQVMDAILEESVTALCGPRGRHDRQRAATRHGHEDGSVVLVAAGSRCAVRGCVRPTARAKWPFPLPVEMINTRSTLWATSASRWLDTSTVPPSSAKLRSKRRNHCTPAGSMPLAGSSKTRSVGSPRRAPATPSRWRIPSEYVLTARSAAEESPTTSSISLTRAQGI